MMSTDTGGLSTISKILLRPLSAVLLLILVGFVVLTISGQSGSIFDKYGNGEGGLNGSETEPADVSEFEKIKEPSPEEPLLEEKTLPITITFVGDMMFDRHIRTNAEKHGNYNFILEPLKTWLTDNDLVVGNLEGPITSNKSRSQGSVPGSTDNFYFTFDSKVLEVLKNYPFVVNLGNNHITNFGADGITETLDFLEAERVPYFGQIDRKIATESLVLTVKNTKIAFVNYNEFIPGGLENALGAIAELKNQADLVIVYTHWGAEYVPTANAVITSQAHQFVDAGANLVVGTHPHVIQNSEIYKNVPIYYSLGNFIFDQYFSEEVKRGLVLRASINPKTLVISLEERLVKMTLDGVTSPLESEGIGEKELGEAREGELRSVGEGSAKNSILE